MGALAAPSLFHKALRFFTLLALGVFVATGCGSENGATSPCSGPGPCQTRLTLLHTGDIHSRLFPFEQVMNQVDSDLGLGTLGEVANVGGIARVAYVLGRERARAGRALHLDTGDCFQGAPVFNFFAGEPEVRSLTALGLDASVIANHEFDRGLNNLVTQMTRWSNFPLLTANYKYEAQSFDIPNAGRLGTIAKPFAVFNREGLKVAVIGMGNLSSLTSIFDQPNRLGIMPLNTIEVAQFYIDLLRPQVDLIVFLTHLGLDVDQRMVRGTTGIDVVMGGHNHIVINPPQEITDCSADPRNPGFVWTLDPNLEIRSDGTPPRDELHPDPELHPYQFKRTCRPRKVIIEHSGAFSKYVGRLDLVLSNDPNEVSPDGNPSHYEPVNGYEVVSSRYTAFPIDASIPPDPIVTQLLEPYRRGLDLVADLDILVGYSPNGARRFAQSGGDSPLGNMVATGMWLRTGIQTDFSLTNSTGIRTDLNPGPITIEQIYNIFPFDNSISKMQLSGNEVQELFDFVARRSAARACTSQAQVAGVRVRLNCASCTRPNLDNACQKDEECRAGGQCVGGKCVVESCAEEVYIGHIQNADGSRVKCATDIDCKDPITDVVRPGQCERRGDSPTGICLSAIKKTNLYELATSNYLAGGGSGYRVLQRNTTQLDTKIQQRDAFVDYLRAGRPCGYVTEPKAGQVEGLQPCSTNAECSADGDFVCACPEAVTGSVVGGALVCKTEGTCNPEQGRCVRSDCRDSVAQFHERRCAGSPAAEVEACTKGLNACVVGGESCKYLACVDETLGNFSDGRSEMIGR